MLHIIKGYNSNVFKNVDNTIEVLERLLIIKNDPNVSNEEFYLLYTKIFFVDYEVMSNSLSIESGIRIIRESLKDEFIIDILNRIKSEGKVPGIYKGTYKNKFSSEFNLYQEIMYFYETNNRPVPEMTDGDYISDYLIYQTREYGVDIPDAKAGERVVKTDCFHKWVGYNFRFEEQNEFALLAGDDIYNLGYEPWCESEEGQKYLSLHKKR